jgi:hypothetical protein
VSSKTYKCETLLPEMDGLTAGKAGLVKAFLNVALPPLKMVI